MITITDHAVKKMTPISVGTSHQAASREFLTFCVGVEEYAIDISQAQEKRGHRGTSTCQCLQHHQGCCQPSRTDRPHRGSEDPLWQHLTHIRRLQRGHGFERAEPVCCHGCGQLTDVVSKSDKHLRPIPEFNASSEHVFVTPIGALENRMLIVLDIEAVVDCLSQGLVLKAMH